MFFSVLVCHYGSGWRRQWHPTPVLLPGKSHGWRSLVGCSPWGRKELETTEGLHFHSSLSCIGEGNGNPLQYCCLENPRDSGAWWAAVYGVAQSWTRLKRLNSMIVGKESACSAGDLSSIPGSGRSPGEGNDKPLQYSCLGNPMDRGAWRATVHRVTRVGHDLATKSPWWITLIYFWMVYQHWITLSKLRFLVNYYPFYMFLDIIC